MCLSIAIRHPENVLATGTHEGFEWIVTNNGSGYRCGYVRVPKGHPWHGKGYMDEGFDPDVYCGITFAQPDLPCDKAGEDDAWWLGFDCAHGGDDPDPELPGSDAPWSKALKLEDGTPRSQEFAESNCLSLCEQAAKALSEVLPD